MTVAIVPVTAGRGPDLAELFGRGVVRRGPAGGGLTGGGWVVGAGAGGRGGGAAA